MVTAVVCLKLSSLSRDCWNVFLFFLSGGGQYGDVYEAVWKRYNKTVAVKTLKVSPEFPPFVLHPHLHPTPSQHLLPHHILPTAVDILVPFHGLVHACLQYWWELVGGRLAKALDCKSRSQVSAARRYRMKDRTGWLYRTVQDDCTFIFTPSDCMRVGKVIFWTKIVGEWRQLPSREDTISVKINAESFEYSYFP